MGTPSQSGLISAAEKNIERMEVRVGKPVTRRPWWQRILLPLSGLILVIAGIIFLFTPIPLSILALIGFPLLFCFHPRIESWARELMLVNLDRLRRAVGRLRRPRRRQPRG